MDKFSKIALATAGAWALIFLALLGTVRLADMSGLWPTKEICRGET